MPFVKKHFNILKSIESSPQGLVGRIPYDWANAACSKSKLELPKNGGLSAKFDRESLLNFCENKDTETIHAVIAILAWGGMRVSHGEQFLNNKDKWISAFNDLRTGKIISRSDAFTKLKELRANNFLPNLGVAYYTKIICFLRPELNGYIMDQWTSKSINLLTNKPVVEISGKWVNDKNTAENYEKFCTYVEKLADELGCSGMNAEQLIFSKGGREKKEWRTYLIDKYKPITK